MSRHIGVVVNPERAELGDEVVRRLRERGNVVTVAAPDEPAGLAAAIDRLVGDGVDVVAAVGGDGTQRTAAERLIGTDVALAPMPAGTVNLLAQVLGVDDVDAAIDAAHDGPMRRIDVGRVDGDVFVLNTSTGWDAAVIERADDGVKRFGRLGFAVTGLRALWQSNARPVRIEVDGDTWYDDTALTAIVLNVGQRASATMHLAPDAEIDDGLLDVVVLRQPSIVAVLHTAWTIVRGRPTPRRELVRRQGRSISIAWESDSAVQRDGDALSHRAELSIGVEPDALRVVSAQT